MLEELEVRNLGPILSSKMEFGAGMTAITGETGAGKSMLLSAVHLISGGPASAARVTPGAPGSWAQGVFDVSEESAAVASARDAGVLPEASAAGDPDPDEAGRKELFLARKVPSSGRSRAMLDGHSVPRSVLGDVAGGLVTIHGQADQLRIAAGARQREFLDMVAGDGVELAAYRQAWDALAAMDSKLEALESQEASARQRADYLRDSVDQINKVNPKPGEDDELKERRSRIENSEQIARGVGTALSQLDTSQVDADSDASGATDAITRAIQALRTIHAGGSFGEAADRLESLNADLNDIVYSLSGQMDDDENVGNLDSINSRIHELDELTRRWGPSLADVIAWRDKAAFEIEDLDASPEKLEELKAKRAELLADATVKAKVLSAARTKAAESLASKVTAELGSLAMAGASLEIRVTARVEGMVNGTTRAPADGAADERAESQGGNSAGIAGIRDVSKAQRTSDARGVKLDSAHKGERLGSSVSDGESSAGLDAHGMDDIEFLFTPFPGSPQLPMGKSASGGELSRLMLALELAAAQKRYGGNDMTFIFDEVDAGVGGKAAVELGKRLARLSRTSQVIVVTHLPQVASWADAQFVVAKESVAKSNGAKSDKSSLSKSGAKFSAATSGAAVVQTTVSKVEGEARVREIARMLSGDETETSLDHARELLAESKL